MPMSHTNIRDIFPVASRTDTFNEFRTYPQFNTLTPDLKKKLIDFMSGKSTLPLTYDPIFKKIFNPDIYPERLSSFISSIIGVPVTVKCVLSNEEHLLHGTALLIMDILVELHDGSIANVEIQKMSFYFPGERMSCYSADLLLRQYSRVKGQADNDNKTFSYSNLKNVYTIIIFEDSPSVMKSDDLREHFVHFGETRFDSEIDIKLLQKYYLIPLDVFKKYYYSERKHEHTTLNGWLSLLSIDNIDELQSVINEYPWVEPIYRDMAMYLENPEEVLNMFSEALRILDQNTIQFMIDDMKKQLVEKDAELAEQGNTIAEQENTIAEQGNTIAEQGNTITEQENTITEQKNIIAEQKNKQSVLIDEINKLKEQINNLNIKLEN